MKAWLYRYNGSPIMDAVRHKHSDVVAFLKRNGAVLHHDKAKGQPHSRHTSATCLGSLIIKNTAQRCRDPSTRVWIKK